MGKIWESQKICFTNLKSSMFSPRNAFGVFTPHCLHKYVKVECFGGEMKFF